MRSRTGRTEQDGCVSGDEAVMKLALAFWIILAYRYCNY